MGRRAGTGFLKHGFEAGAIALVTTAASLALAAPAGAVGLRPLKGSFCEPTGLGAPPCEPSFAGAPKESAASMAVDQSTGDVLVIDIGAGTVTRYKANGEPDPFSALGTNVIDGKGSGPPCTPPSSECDGTPQDGLSFGDAFEVQVAVDESGTATDGDIYVTQAHQIDIFASSGEYLGQLTEYKEGPTAGGPLTPFGESCGVAVDPGGALYVGDFSGQIHKFTSQGAPHNPLVTSDSNANFETVVHPCTLAAGAGPTAGSLFAARFNGPVSKLNSATGALQYPEPVAEGENVTVTVDPADGHVFVAENEGGGSGKVAEYDASGSAPELVALAEPASLPEGVAVNGADDDLYVSRESSPNVEVYGSSEVLPTPESKPATDITSHSATLNGAVNPEGVELSECTFEYLTQAEYEGDGNAFPASGAEVEPCAETPAEIGDGTELVPVHAEITSLAAGATYRYRLVAANASGSAPSAEETFKTLSPPVIAAQWASDVTFGEATLNAKVNPEGEATTYRFQYGTSEAYGHETPELPVGSDSSPHTLSAPLEGLTPDTVYHYRVLADNAIGPSEGEDRTFTTYAPPVADACPNAAFRTGPGAGLPDCRAYEMVSPIDKGGGDIVAATNVGNGSTAYTQAAIEGDKITYTSSTAFGDAVRGAYANQYIATRGTGGWTSQAINPPQGATVFDPGFSVEIDLQNNFQAFTPDLCHALLIDDNLEPLTPNAIPGFTNLYWRDNCGAGAGSYEAVTSGEPPTSSESEENLEARNHSSDRGQVVFAAHAALTPDALPGNENAPQIYDFSAGGSRHLVSKLPDGEASSGRVGTGTGQAATHNYTLANAVSADASRVFWTAGNGNGPGSLYVRLNPGHEETSAKDEEGNCVPDPVLACTVAIFEETGSAKAGFWTASTTGSKAIFSAGGNLYEYQVASKTKIKIAGQADGVVGASEDLSNLYFTAEEAIPGSGENAQHQEAEAGQVNLYLRRGGEDAFIATLAAADSGHKCELCEGIDSANPERRTSRVSPDGRDLAFTSQSASLAESVAGYDNTDQASGKPDSEVYLFDAEDGQLVCASCNPSGARPAGVVALGEFKVPIAARIKGWQWSDNASRNLTTEGGIRLFFESYDSLVPADTNGQLDVYEWEAPGTGPAAGRCSPTSPSFSAQDDGCIALLSTGHSPAESTFVDASADGRDAFISTQSSIDSRDPGLVDIYDAREEGGFPPPGPEPPPCVGDACQVVPAPPALQGTASTNFEGPGNAEEPPSHKKHKSKNKKHKHKQRKHHRARRAVR